MERKAIKIIKNMSGIKIKNGIKLNIKSKIGKSARGNPLLWET